MVKYNIISTGSDGNATILEDFVLIDCGVPCPRFLIRIPVSGWFRMP